MNVAGKNTFWQMLHGGRVDNHASDAVNAIGEFVWSPLLSTEEACPQAGTPAAPPEEARWV